MAKRRQRVTAMPEPAVVCIDEVLDGHVAVDVECVDRLYLNAYVPNLQVGGQVVRFLTSHLGNPIPSPALFEKIGNRFRREVKAYAQRHGIPILALRKPDRTRWDDRKLDHVRPYLQAAERAGRYGVVAIVSAQEFQWVFSGRDVATQPGAVCYAFDKSERRVGTYYLSVGGPPVKGGSRSPSWLRDRAATAAGVKLERPQRSEDERA